MKHVGLILFILGTIVASAYASRRTEFPEGMQPTPMQRITTWGGQAGAPFAVGLVLMVVGGVVARRQRHTAKSAGGTVGSRKDPKTMLESIASKLSDLPTASEMSASELHEKLDAVLEEDVPAFLESRQAMIDDMGLAKFAEMIGQFAVMERNVARAWSALTDEVYHEVDPSLARARVGLEHAQGVFVK